MEVTFSNFCFKSDLKSTTIHSDVNEFFYQNMAVN